MRNSDRIYSTLLEMASLWANTIPDWRFMQVVANFQSWLGSDGFYLEDDQFLEKFKKYINELKRYGYKAE